MPCGKHASRYDACEIAIGKRQNLPQNRPVQRAVVALARRHSQHAFGYVQTLHMRIAHNPQPIANHPSANARIQQRRGTLWQIPRQ